MGRAGSTGPAADFSCSFTIKENISKKKKERKWRPVGSARCVRLMVLLGRILQQPKETHLQVMDNFTCETRPVRAQFLHLATLRPRWTLLSRTAAVENLITSDQEQFPWHFHQLRCFFSFFWVCLSFSWMIPLVLTSGLKDPHSHVFIHLSIVGS